VSRDPETVARWPSGQSRYFREECLAGTGVSPAGGFKSSRIGLIWPPSACVCGRRTSAEGDANDVQREKTFLQDTNSHGGVRWRIAPNRIGTRQPHYDQSWCANQRRSELAQGGIRGASLLEDFVLREKIHHFDHERIPERIVHARGSGAHGYFELTESLTKFTRARMLTQNRQEDGIVRALLDRGRRRGFGRHAARRPGFAVKFYTTEGNWDLVGNNIPVFFIQDAIKFPTSSTR